MTRFVLACCLLLPLRSLADGGKVEFRKTAGPYIVTLFSSPIPLRIGPADLSVMVQNASDQSPVLDAPVTFQVDSRLIRATHDQATNKLLYAATVDFEKAGPAEITVNINSQAKVSGTLTVFPAQPPIVAYWPYFAVVPAAILLYLLNRYLRRSRERPSRRYVR